MLLATSVRSAGNSSAMTTRRQVSTVATRRSSHTKEKKPEVALCDARRTATTAAGAGLARVDLVSSQELADLVSSLNDWGRLTSVAAPSLRLFRSPSSLSEPCIFGPAFGPASNGALSSVAAACRRRSTSSTSSSASSAGAIQGTPSHEIAMAGLLAFAASASFVAGGQMMNASASSSSSTSYGSGGDGGGDGNWGGSGGGPPGGGDATFMAAAALSSFGWGAEDSNVSDEARQDWDTLDDGSLVTDSVSGSWDRFWGSVRVGRPFLGGSTLVGSDPAEVATDNPKTVEAATRTGTNDRTRPDHYEVSVKALRGVRLSMEDEWVVAEGGRFAAVFDGHGGGGVSSYLRDSFYSSFLSHVHRLQSKNSVDSLNGQEATRASRGGDVDSRAAAMRASLYEMERSILADETFDYQGSTAVTVLVHEDDDGRRTILTANVGDSRAILSRRGRSVDLTRDHKPNDDVEKRRILDMGEEVEWDSYSKVYRVRNLSLSRAIGDKFAKPAVSPEPEIKVFPSVSSSDRDPFATQAVRSDGSVDTKSIALEDDDDDEFVVLASDGLWDVMNSQDVVDFVHRRLSAPPAVTSPTSASPQPTASLAKRPTWSAKSMDEQSRILRGRRKNMSKYLAQEAIMRGSGDNVSVVLIWLKDQEVMAKQQEEERNRRRASSIAARLTSRR